MWTTLVEDLGGHIKVMTENELSCTVIIGFESEDLNTTVRLNKFKPAQRAGADRWRYTTRDHFALDCSKTQRFNQFEPEVINESLSTMSHYTGSDMDGDGAVSDDNAVAGLVDMSDMSILFILGSCSRAGAIVFVILIVIRVSCIKRHRKNKSRSFGENSTREEIEN
jgi:hypothetical protein